MTLSTVYLCQDKSGEESSIQQHVSLAGLNIH